MQIEIEKTRVIITLTSGQIFGAFKDDEFVPTWFSSNEAEDFYSNNWELIDEKVSAKIYNYG